MRYLNEPPKLEDILKVKQESLSSVQKENLELGHWIILKPEQISGYNCGKCGPQDGPPKVDRHVFPEPVSGGETYGIVNYNCNSCNQQLGQAKIREDDWISDLAEGFHKIGGYWSPTD